MLGAFFILVSTIGNFIICPVAGLQVSEAVRNRIVRRPNFGAAFNFQQQITVHSENYVHHIIFDLPDQGQAVLKQFRDLTTIWRDISQRSEGPLTFPIVFRKALAYEAKSITHLINTIYDLFPQLELTPSGSRNTRFTVCWVCGKILQFFEGVAMQEDVDAVREILQQSADLTQRHFESIERTLSSMGSFSRITDQKFDALRTIIRLNQNNTMATLESMVDMQAATLALINIYIANADQLLELRNALTLLTRKILTFDLLLYKQAERIWEEIGRHVRELSIFYPAESSYMSLYNSDLYYFRVGERLHIGRLIKLSPFQAPLSMFKLETFALDVTGQNHATILAKQPLFVAWNDLDDTYLTFSERPTLKDDKFYVMGTEQHVLHQKSDPSCIISLFNDQLEDVTALCPTLLIPNLREPVLKYLGANLLLIRDIESYTITGPKNETWQVRPQCTPCIVKVPCGIRLQAADITLFIPSCIPLSNANETQSTSHLANFHVIAPLLNSDLLGRLSSEFAFDEPLNVSLPVFKVFESDHELDQAFKILETPNIDLMVAINRTLQDAQVFRTRSDVIEYKLQHLGMAWNSTFNWSSLTSWIQSPFQFSTNLILLLMLVAMAYLFYKIHILAGAISLLQTGVHAVEVVQPLQRDIEQFFLPKTTTQATAPRFAYSPQISEQYHPLDAMICVLIIGVWLYIIWSKVQRMRHRHTIQLYVEVVGQSESLKIPVLKLPHDMGMYKFTASSFVDSISISGMWRPQVNIHWPSLLIQHRFLTKQLTLPRTHTIAIWQARKLARILAADFEILLFTISGNSGEFELIPLENSSWRQFQSSRMRTVERADRSWRATASSYDSPPEYV